MDASSGNSSTRGDDDDDIGDHTTDEQSQRTADSDDTVHITDNITITQPVYVDHH